MASQHIVFNPSTPSTHLGWLITTLFTQELFFQVFFFSLQFCEVGGPVIIHKRTSSQIWLQVKEASKIIVWDIVSVTRFH